MPLERLKLMEGGLGPLGQATGRLGVGKHMVWGAQERGLEGGSGSRGYMCGSGGRRLWDAQRGSGI